MLRGNMLKQHGQITMITQIQEQHHYKNYLQILKMYLIFVHFQPLWSVLALHLNHGVESAFQTLGVKTRLYRSTIHKAVHFFSFVIPALFASIPIYIFWKQL